jgi:hypothetical protein
VIPSYLLLVAPVSWGTLVLEVREALGADGASLGAIGIEVDGAHPRPGDGTGGLLWDLVLHGANISAPGSAAPGDVIEPLSPQVLRARGYPGCSCCVPPTLRYRLTTRGRWKTMRHSCPRRSLMRRGCCMRQWLSSVRRSCIRFELV